MRLPFCGQQNSPQLRHKSMLSVLFSHQPIIIPITILQWPREPRNLFLDSPLNSPSPPTNTMKAMRLFDGLTSPNSACAISSPRSAPRVLPLKSRLIFDEDGEPRRCSFPGIGSQFHKNLFVECDSTSSAEKPKLANINPFTPTAMIAANRRKRNMSRRSIAS